MDWGKLDSVDAVGSVGVWDFGHRTSCHKTGGGVSVQLCPLYSYKIDSLSWRVLDTGVEVNKD